MSESADLLSHDQRAEFERSGFLVIEDAVDDETCAAAREATWEAMPDGVDRDDPATWVGVDGLEELPTHEPFEEITQQVWEYARALVGDSLAPRGEKPATPCQHADVVGSHPRFPVGKSLPATDENYDPVPHLDGVAPDHDDRGYLPFSIAATLYIDWVRPYGGGFTVWPGSHHVVSEWFQDNEWEDLDYGEPPSDLREAIGVPKEVTGDPGTLTLWHHNLCHTGGPNLSDHIRMACIPRFSRSDIADIERGGLRDTWRHYDTIE
jgi:hypothetical protein